MSQGVWNQGVWGKLGGAGIGLAAGGPLGALLGAVAAISCSTARARCSGPPPRVGVHHRPRRAGRQDGEVGRGGDALRGRGLRRHRAGAEDERAGVSSACSTSPSAPPAASRAMPARWRRPSTTSRRSSRTCSTGSSTSPRRTARSTRARRATSPRWRRSSASTDARFAAVTARHVRLADDPYEVLGAARDLTDADLKARYRALVSENHPDGPSPRPAARRRRHRDPAARRDQRRLRSHRRRAASELS